MKRKPTKAQIAADEANIRALQQEALRQQNDERIARLRKEAEELKQKKAKGKKKGGWFW